MCSWQSASRHAHTEGFPLPTLVPPSLTLSVYPRSIRALGAAAVKAACVVFGVCFCLLLYCLRRRRAAPRIWSALPFISSSERHG